MKLEDQVCSLELAKRLKELGVKQESVFWWEHCQRAGEDYVCSVEEARLKKGCCSPICSAFTVAELGEMLHKVTFKFPCPAAEGFYHFEGNEIIYSKNEADARAAKLIDVLREKGIVKP